MRAITSPDPATLAAYQRSLDHVFAQSRELLPAAPTWQAGLYQSVRACYSEMRAHPESLRLHFLSTTRDPAVQHIRTQHRDRLLALLHASRPDPPRPLHAELLLSMIHSTLRTKIARDEEPPPVDDAEQAFAELLFHHGSPQAA